MRMLEYRFETYKGLLLWRERIFLHAWFCILVQMSTLFMIYCFDFSFHCVMDHITKHNEDTGDNVGPLVLKRKSN